MAQLGPIKKLIEYINAPTEIFFIGALDELKIRLTQLQILTKDNS